MIHGKITIDRTGALFVAYETVSDDTPEIVTLFWRVVAVRGTGYGERPSAGNTVQSEIGRPWSAYDATTKRHTGTVDTGPGDLQAEYVERRDVPAPKVRRGIELRWYRGVWQKSTTKGWVRA